MSSRTPVERYFAAINAECFDDLAAVFREDVEIHTVGTKPVLGRKAALAHFPNILADYAEHEDRVTRWIDAAPDGTGTVVTEVDFAGMLRDGRAVRFDALDVFDLDRGRIFKVTTWYDTRAVRRQVIRS